MRVAHLVWLLYSAASSRDAHVHLSGQPCHEPVCVLPPDLVCVCGQNRHPHEGARNHALSKPDTAFLREFMWDPRADASCKSGPGRIFERERVCRKDIALVTAAPAPRVGLCSLRSAPCGVYVAVRGVRPRKSVMTCVCLCEFVLCSEGVRYQSFTRWSLADESESPPHTAVTWSEGQVVVPTGDTPELLRGPHRCHETSATSTCTLTERHMVKLKMDRARPSTTKRVTRQTRTNRSRSVVSTGVRHSACSRTSAAWTCYQHFAFWPQVNASLEKITWVFSSKKLHGHARPPNTHTHTTYPRTSRTASESCGRTKMPISWNKL